MPAVVCARKGPWRSVLELRETRPEPSASAMRSPPAPTQLDLAVAAAGVAFPDVLTVEGKHVRPLGQTPLVAGREVAGRVTAVGADAARAGFRVGDWVMADSVNGGWADTARVEMSTAHKFDPSRVDPRAAAGFALNYGTSYHALVHQGELKRGETLLVLGASGGVGSAAVEIGKALGAVVVACASSPDKLDICRRLGADHVVDYRSPAKMREEVERVTGGRAATKAQERGGVDVVFDPVGGAWSEPAMRLLRFGGRFLVLGFASGSDQPKSAIPRVPLNLALLNERKICGVLFGTWRANNPDLDREAVRDLLRMMDRGDLRPHVESFPVARWRDAVDALMGRRVVGKVVLAFDVAEEVGVAGRPVAGGRAASPGVASDAPGPPRL